MKISITAILDSIFSGFICFIVCFFLLNYFIDRHWAIIFSVIISLPVATIALKKLHKKKMLLILKNQEEKQKEACISSLNLLQKDQVVDVFLNALKDEKTNIERKKNALFLTEKKCALFFCFSFDKVTKTDVVRAFNAMPKDYTAYIFSNSFSSEVAYFINRFSKKIIAVDGVKTYKFLKQKNCVPEKCEQFNDKKLKFGKAIKGLFQRKNAKRYFFFGVSFLAMSYFVPIKVYYIVIGCLFLIFSLFCRLFGNEKIEN